MSKAKIGIAIFILGIAAGIIFGINKVGADTPVKTDTTVAPGAKYDEYWKASEALVSDYGGYKKFEFYDSITYPLPADPDNKNTETAGELEQDSKGNWTVKLFPKMVVTKWKVHGHIHF